MNERQKELKRQYLATQRSRERNLLPLTDAEVENLLDFLDHSLGARSCDHSFAVTQMWLAAHGKAEDAVLRGLREFGAYCDCEVLANVENDLV